MTIDSGGAAVNRRPKLKQLFLVVASVILAHSLTLAGLTGKISGTVTDAVTGGPLAGATVRVIGTDLAAMTDEDGEYFIINVPSGKYDVAISHVGFEFITKKEVRVLLDLTTPVDFTVRQVAVELKQELVVYATNPLIQKDLTASKVIFTADRLHNLPNVNTIQAVLSNYPGVVTDKGNELHVRGGRSGQINYLYDGFSVVDPFIANVGMRIMPTALEELSLTSSGFAAEYGEALSGIVSAVTPEGGSRYRGRLRMYEGATEVYDLNTGDWGNLSRSGNRSMSGALSGPLPGLNSEKYTFSASGEYLKDNSYLPHDGTVSWGGTTKIAMQPAARVKLVTNLVYDHSRGDLYTHRDVNSRSYDFDLSGLPSFERTAYLAGLTLNYNVSDRAILSGTVNRFSTESRQAPQNLFDVYWNQWPGYSEDSTGRYNGTIQQSNYNNNIDKTDPYQVTGFARPGDFNPTYRYRKAAYNAVSASYLTQLNKTNQVKVGLEYSRYLVDWDSKQFFNSNPYGEKYTSRPVYASFYAQDKLEYTDFVINLGMRYDYRNADISYNYTPMGEAHYKQASPTYRFSPRLGVSFPVTDKAVMHFNYGVYYQQPRYTYLYTNLKGDLSSGLPLLGNPDLKPEQTSAYELGVDNMIGDNLRLDATAYYKDITDLVTTRLYGRNGVNAITMFDNGDYGNVKGIDFGLEKLALKGFLSGSISYGYMIAMGKGASATDPYYTYLTSNIDTLAPVKEYRLDFDQRHTLTAVLDYRVPGEWKGNLFGLPIPGGWGFNFVGYYGSGLPYTKTDSNGNRLGERNEGQLPANYSVDMRFNKDFRMGPQKSMLTFFVEVDNLFDRRNVLNVYTRTGLADNDNQQQTLLSASLNQMAALDHLYDHDPQNYSAPRTVRTGLEFRF